MTKHLHRQIDGLKQKILLRRHAGRRGHRQGDLGSRQSRRAIWPTASSTNDAMIDRMEVEVEEECLKILALYQPVAADLRFVVAVLKINNDLERMGDLASNIAKRVPVSGQRRADRIAGRIPRHGDARPSTWSSRASTPW